VGTGLFHSEALIEERRHLLDGLMSNLLSNSAAVETGLVQQFAVLEELLNKIVT
jgi:hypothetical protein